MADASAPLRGDSGVKNASDDAENPQGDGGEATYHTLPTSVLCTAPGTKNLVDVHYTNLTPWVTRLFFVHTYFAYVYVFYMFVLAFYKGYALEYPDMRRAFEMTLIMLIPGFQHLRFYFGYWGCELGMTNDLCVFVFLCSGVMVLLMYFQFMQAYILPFESTFLFVAVSLVGVEGICGILNLLQTIKLQSSNWFQLCIVTFSVMLLLLVETSYMVRELLPHEAEVEDIRYSKAVWNTPAPPS